MKIEENHRSCKRSRVGNGNEDAAKLGDRENHQDEDEDDGEAKGDINNNNSRSNNNNNRAMRPWHHPSSRIFRVSRASGGKDRHSKVYTAKGLRDRRIRLSVSTAIQFYDLQDRLGYDQPSKAIEWLIKAAVPAIAELPFLETTFPEPINQQQVVNMEQQPMPSDSGMDPEADPSHNQQQHSSTSETSKGSVLSLSRSEIRVKARERAKVRVRDKEKDREDAHVVSHVDQSLNSQGSFTKLLTGGCSSNTASVTAGQVGSSANFIQKQMQNLPPVTSTANYFSTQSSLFGQQLQQHHTPQPKTTHQIPTGFSSQAHFGNNSPIGMVPLIGNAGDHTVEMQQFAFLQDHFFPVAAAAATTSGGDYNLKFSISPSLTGFNRGTLQSNSPPHHHHHHHHQLSHHHHNHHQVQAQRLSSALDGPSIPFFFGAAATATATAPTENPYSTGFDGHLQLCDGYKHLELKGKGKG